MSKSQPSTIRFWLIAGTTIVVAAATLAVSFPYLVNVDHSVSAHLTTVASRAGNAAEADYQLAVWLNPSNTQAQIGLATCQLADGDPAAALASLTHAGKGSRALYLRVAALIDASQFNEAAAAAQTLLANFPSNNSIVLAALAEDVAGHPAQAASLASRVTSAQASRRILTASAGKLPLAYELYATGLLNASDAMLKSLPHSYARDVLRGQIEGQQGSVKLAIADVQSALQQNPSSVYAHQLLQALYLADHNQGQASSQKTLLANLAAGRP